MQGLIHLEDKRVQHTLTYLAAGQPPDVCKTSCCICQGLGEVDSRSGGIDRSRRADYEFTTLVQAGSRLGLLTETHHDDKYWVDDENNEVPAGEMPEPENNQTETKIPYHI